MTGRDDLHTVFRSKPHTDWARTHPLDAKKVTDEYAGKRRPSPSSMYAKGLVGLCRRFPPVATPAPPPPNPKPTVPEPLALVRRPGGNVEDIARYKRAGLRGLLLNLDYPPNDWQTIRGRCDAIGMPWGYWLHCDNTPSQAYAVAKLDRLLDHSKSLPFVGINVESHLDDWMPPALIADRYRASGTDATPVLIALGWAPNSARFTADDTAEWHLMLEMFPADAPSLMPPTAKWPVCVDHARQLGHRGPIMQLAQCYGQAQPSWYTPPYSLFTLDDSSPRIEEWL